ncbi:MAG TPA: ABC transporter ATP-binding protein [Bacteroidales bacterium]|nr:ABC transporter ATP-binding protein [Bacteroidales bacterium]HOM40731.1 ABC transporter ATP-binding protein [Bacteroidales bacterium]HPP91274.1 ABC transporter ATP-binding protein [Bacteroidales bacterium]HRR15493.1 ABC transporter ATP-binding protein [Bacteroidales bacterium]HRT46879.1 ABC transporter ATP-binding protein [Bacteroidales bacterium]
MKIEIRDLNKIYPNGTHALKNINLVIESGMFGLLGPNGAGKSTLMRILVTLVKPTSGIVLLDGKDIQKHRKEVRKILGYLPQDFRFFTSLKTWEFLDYSAALAGMKNRKERLKEVDRMLDQVGLLEVRDRNANKLSGGMKRRLGIAQALIGNPKLFIVDEPTTGLDPDERIRFRNILSTLSQKQDVIIILSTHIVGDISSTCQNMALLNKGEVVFCGRPENLVNEAKGHVFKMNLTPYEYEKAKEEYDIISTIPVENGWEVQIVSDLPPDGNAVEIEPNIEHAYVYYMEHKIHADLNV